MTQALAPDDVVATHEQARANARPPLLVIDPLRDFLDERGLGAGQIVATPTALPASDRRRTRSPSLSSLR